MAAVQFTADQLYELITNYIGEPEPGEIQEAMDRFADTTVNQRDISASMRFADELIDGSGVEALYVRDGQVVTDGWDSTPLCEYVNVGDTYSPTIIYMSEEHAFRIGSWGDVAETWENQNPPVDRDLCSDCGQEFAMDEMILRGDADNMMPVCRECDKKRGELPTWNPESKDAVLVAMLRAVEGDQLAVHYLPHGDHQYELAFSSVMATPIPAFVALREGRPYSLEWPKVIEFFKRDDPQLYVAGYGKDIGGRSVSIEREMFARLRVAMDAFFEAGMERQPERTMLTVPPVLWTERDVVGCVWHEERGDATVECYVNPNPERDEDVPPGSDLGDLSLWGAREAELEEMIENGMFRWKNDADVTQFLREQGILR